MNENAPRKKLPNVVLTTVNVSVLALLAKYHYLSRRIIQAVLFSHCKSPKATNTRLKKLKLNGYIARAAMTVVQNGHNPVPIYYLTKKGAIALAEATGNSDYLNCITKPPSPHLLYHWLGIVEAHLMIDKAIDLEAAVELLDFYSEWETINKDQTKKSLQFSLHTKLQEDPPLSMAPDFGFAIELAGYKKCFYGEWDTGLDSIRRIQRKKPGGYFLGSKNNIHHKHFGECGKTSFSILFITTTEYRRDELARQIGQRDGAGLWRFATKSDLSPESFFRLPVWKNCDGEFVRLIKS